MKRARPALGTLVEIRATGAPGIPAELVLARVEKAFAAIEQVERLMSFYREDSDISHINQASAGKVLTVHPLTAKVLRWAKRFERQTHGRFDVRIGAALQKHGRLPSCARTNSDGGTWELMPGNRVHVKFPVCLDLGGLAKGFAVDQAVRALCGKGVTSGVVNAGGDLRVFGDATEPVHVRLPEDRGFTALPVGLREAAAAGSGAAWTDSSRMSDVIDPSTGQRVHVTHTFLAVAPQGIIAEMLTKLALLQDPRLGRIARQYDAMLYRVDASGIVEELDLS